MAFEMRRHVGVIARGGDNAHLHLDPGPFAARDRQLGLTPSSRRVSSLLLELLTIPSLKDTFLEPWKPGPVSDEARLFSTAEAESLGVEIIDAIAKINGVGRLDGGDNRRCAWHVHPPGPEVQGKRGRGTRGACRADSAG